MPLLRESSRVFRDQRSVSGVSVFVHVVAPEKVTAQEKSARNGEAGFFGISHNALKFVCETVTDKRDSTNPGGRSEHVELEKAAPIHAETASQRAKDGPQAKNIARHEDRQSAVALNQTTAGPEYPVRRQVNAVSSIGSKSRRNDGRE